MVTIGILHAFEIRILNYKQDAEFKLIYFVLLTELQSSDYHILMCFNVKVFNQMLLFCS